MTLDKSIMSDDLQGSQSLNDIPMKIKKQKQWKSSSEDYSSFLNDNSGASRKQKSSCDRNSNDKIPNL